MSGVTFLEVSIVVIVIVFLIAYFANKAMDVVIVKANTDNRSYIVRNLPDKQAAADMLGNLNKKMIALVKHMNTKYGNNKDVKRLVRNFNPDNVSESGRNDTFTSYSINKGERIVFCLRSKDSKHTLQDENLLMYVAIHELGHLMTKEVGHNDPFWKNNRILLTEAIKMKLYQKIDFDKEPAKYCGINISTSIV